MPSQADDSNPSIPSCLPTDPTGTFQSINASQRTTRAPGSPPPVGFFSITGGETMSIAQTPINPEVVPAQLPTGSPAAYVLHRVIGRGGFGEVWQATQVSIGRAVAVKRLRADVASEGGSREWEFRQEALTAAHLEHPNIVPVHDLGVDEAGRPVIAMKMVRGRPWSDAITEDFHKMTVPEFLGKNLPILMATVQAVAFAHSKGIIHRDLKPSQVMAGEFGEVMLMDWGLAVHVGEQPAEMNFDLPTRDSASSPSGTPAYMAPEQTRETAEGIGIWTDIYLLGATLYHLLTGAPPHMADSSREAFIKASKGEFERPEKRAQKREVPVELEAICLRAMQTKPADRYDSAQAFLQALQDYLSGAARRRQSIELTQQSDTLLRDGDIDYLKLGQVEHDCARALALWPENENAARVRESAIRRHAQRALAHGDLSLARVQAGRLAPGAERHEVLRKVDEGELALERQASQRRMAIAASFVLLVVLLAASIVFTKRVATERDAAHMARAQAEAARSQEAAARGEAEVQRDAAQKARAEAEKQRERALAALQSSEDLVKFMLTDLRERLAPRDASLELLDAVSRRALDHYAAQTSGTLMIADKQRIVPGMLALSGVLRVQGRTDDSFVLASQLTQVARELHGSDSRNREFARLLSMAMGEYAQASIAKGNYDFALELLGEDAERLRVELKSSPADQELMDDFLSVLSFIGYTHFQRRDFSRFEAAWTEFENVVASAKAAGIDTPALRIREASASANIARALQEQMKSDEAKTRYDKAANILEEVYTADPTNKEAMGQLMNAHYHSGNFALQALQDVDSAETHFARAVEVAESLTSQYPDDLPSQQQLAVTLDGLSKLMMARGNFPEAIEQLTRREEISARLLERDPQNLQWGIERANAAHSLGEACSRARMKKEAQEAFARARAAYESVLSRQPDHPKAVFSLASLENSEAAAAMGAKDHAEAEKKFREVVRLLEGLCNGPNPTVHNREQLANSYGNLWATLAEQKKYEEMLVEAKKELAIRESLHAEDPKLDAGRTAFTRCVFGVAEAAMHAGKYDEARQFTGMSISYLEGEYLKVNDDKELQRRLGQHLKLRGQIERAAGDPSANEYFTRSAELLQPLTKGFFPDARIVAQYTLVLLELDRLDEAKEMLKKVKPEAMEPGLKELIEKKLPGVEPGG